METKKQKKLFNIIMIAVIIVIIAAGVTGVGLLKGWFSSEGTAFATAGQVTGIVNVERDGVSFELKEGDAIRSGDRISTGTKAEIKIISGNNSVALSEESVVSLKDDDGRLTADIESGEAFFTADERKTFGTVSAGGTDLSAGENDGAVFSANVQTGSMGACVFGGEIRADRNEKTDKGESGQIITVSGEEMTVGDLSLSSLNEFNIKMAIEASESRELCFSAEELQNELEDRAAAASDTQEEADEQSGEKQPASGSEVGKSGSSEEPSDSGSVKDSPSDGGSGQDKEEQSQPPEQENKYDYTCTIDIRCDTIFDNMDKLDPSKEGYVPSSGYILSPVKVGFNEGENVLDVLKRVCGQYGIHLEYSYSPVYDSGYVEGINHLYEFDCGPQSGWIYKVNSWAPNYGSTKYEVRDGDVISWRYTCVGLGADV